MVIGKVDTNKKAFIVAELSGNHGGDINKAYKLIKAAADASADAVKLQTYTPDTITLNSNKSYFHTNINGLWAGKTLYQLYSEAYTPWSWHKELKDYAESLGLEFFSTPFDITSADYLEELGIPCYKISSFEIKSWPSTNFRFTSFNSLKSRKTFSVDLEAEDIPWEMP